MIIWMHFLYQRPVSTHSNNFTESIFRYADSRKAWLKNPVNERVYELRSYEGHTEKIYRNKVEMFNAGDEVGLFKRLGFNAVFYGEVLSGANMPNLMYMTTFENKASRDAHWKLLWTMPNGKPFSAMPEYKNNVLKIEIFFYGLRHILICKSYSF